MVDGLNLYRYSRNNPIRFSDPGGTQGTDAQEMMMGMMWERVGQELAGMIEGFVGGKAYVNPQANKVEYSRPEGGVGGVVGGVTRAATLRAVPIENNPSPASLQGMEAGASMVPVLNPAEKLVTGETVTGQETSRWWAAAELAADVAPVVMEIGFAGSEARANMSLLESTAVSDMPPVPRQSLPRTPAAEPVAAGAAPRGPEIIDEPAGAFSRHWQRTNEVVDPAVVKQQTNVDCGPACIEMVEGIPQSQTSTGKTMTSQEVLNKLQERNASWTGQVFDPGQSVAGLSDKPGVAMMYGDKNHHFVVVEEATPTAVKIHDPWDQTSYSMENQCFDANWSGIYLWRKQ